MGSGRVRRGWDAAALLRTLTGLPALRPAVNGPGCDGRPKTLKVSKTLSE